MIWIIAGGADPCTDCARRARGKKKKGRARRGGTDTSRTRRSKPPIDGLVPRQCSTAGRPALCLRDCHRCLRSPATPATTRPTMAGRRPGHGSWWFSDAWRAAIEEVGNPACSACHLSPSDVQRPESTSRFDNRRREPGRHCKPNPAFDATLYTGRRHLCRVPRAGRNASSALPPSQSPQPCIREWAGPPRSHRPGIVRELPSAQLARRRHDRSTTRMGSGSGPAYAEAGVDCVTCHLGPGAHRRARVAPASRPIWGAR